MILLGDNRETLKTLPDCSVHCCVTSPPYWGLRDYGHADQIGLEKTPEEYVANMVTVFREVRRVLRDDGTLWLNLGDSYNAHPGQRSVTDKPGDKQATNNGSIGAPSRHVDSLKPKDLVGIPWMVAFALRADGWYLRSDIIWSKPNPMPESVTDRPTKAHEYLFLLSKSPRYFYDAEAVKEEGSGTSGGACFGKQSAKDSMAQQRQYERPEYGTRNRRSVWTIPTAPYKEAHFATYPPKLIEPCILAGTSDKGCCSQCGNPWERVVGDTGQVAASHNGSRFDRGKTRVRDGGDRTQPGIRTTKLTTGWQPTCDCHTEPVPCIVLDPFGGSGTTAGVAQAFGRQAILCELSPQYAQLIPARIQSIVDWYYGRATPKTEPTTHPRLFT